MTERPKILVVEDNYLTRTLLEETLSLEGYRVRVLGDGSAVPGEVARELPDLIVLDVMMPGTDGFSVLEGLRADDRTYHVPVLMLTALDDNDSTWKGWTGGCNYYMTKPFETEDLLRVIGSLTGVAA